MIAFMHTRLSGNRAFDHVLYPENMRGYVIGGMKGVERNLC